MTQAFVNDLGIYIRAGYPIVTIVSSEEDRARELIDEMLRQGEMAAMTRRCEASGAGMAASHPLPQSAGFASNVSRDVAKRARKLFVWSISRGLVDAKDRPASKEDTRPPERALAFVADCEEEAVFLFKDFHPYLKDTSPGAALLIRQLRDLVPVMKGSQRTLLWLSPMMQIPPELQKDVTVVDLPLPTESEYRQVVEQAMAQARANPTVTVDMDENAIDAIVKACQGLTRSEAENALYKSVVAKHGLTGQDVKSILDEKEQIIRKSGILEYMAAVEDFNGIGGLGQLKRWLGQRNEGFSQKARDFGLPNPRGVMLVGVPGCGKSLCAKAVAAEWQKPLLKFDLGRVFAGLVGESEERMRRALAVAENVAPCVLWIDEMEKGLAGIGGAGDSGVATRVFGTLLTWMEEKSHPVFVVATANNIEQLPPELLRKGRLDEIFFVDLPTARDRAEILMIHLSKRQRAPADYDISALVRASDGFSGAELEEVVIDALYEAYSSPERMLKTEHLLNSARQIIPLSRSRARDIEALRQWAAVNCRMAASEETPDADSIASRRVRALDI